MTHDVVRALREATFEYRESHAEGAGQQVADYVTCNESEARHWRDLLRVAIAMDNCITTGMSEKRVSDIVGRSLYLHASITARGYAARPYHPGYLHVTHTPLRVIGLSKVKETEPHCAKYAIKPTNNPVWDKHKYRAHIRLGERIRSYWPCGASRGCYTDVEIARWDTQIQPPRFHPAPFEGALRVRDGVAYFQVEKNVDRVSLESIFDSACTFRYKSTRDAGDSLASRRRALSALTETCNLLSPGSRRPDLKLNVDSWAISHLMEIIILESARII